MWLWPSIDALTQSASSKLHFRQHDVNWPWTLHVEWIKFFLVGWTWWSGSITDKRTFFLIMWYWTFLQLYFSTVVLQDILVSCTRLPELARLENDRCNLMLLFYFSFNVCKLLNQSHLCGLHLITLTHVHQLKYLGYLKLIGSGYNWCHWSPIRWDPCGALNSDVQDVYANGCTVNGAVQFLLFQCHSWNQVK